MDLSTLMPQQLEIVKTLDEPLFVSAGAGSGKTFTLTRRILYALSPESGPFVKHLDQVLAITFTKDAAAEIRERVRAALVAEGMDEEALTVDDAWISTIHGMCSRILRAHALELGVDPEFSVLTDTDELMDRAVDHVMMRAGSGDSCELRLDHLCEWFDMAGEGGPFGRGTTVKGLVRELLELASTLPGGMDDVRIMRGNLDLASLADAYRPCLGASRAAAEKAQAALDAIDTFEQSDRTMADACRLMMACGMPRASKAFPKEQVALLKAEAGEAFVNLVLACGGPALDELETLARAVDAEYRSLKAEQGVLDNNDLLRLTYEAFRDHASIRDAFRGRFKMVMIDEFQDTDQMQVDLVRYLTGEGERALCTVGDAQQSIYRFRGAEVEVFRRQEQKIAPKDVGEDGSMDGSADDASEETKGRAAGGKLVKLVRNFRSHDEVLRYVARVFDGGDGGLMDGFLDLEASDARKDTLKAEGVSRRQALFVAGGSTQERTEAKARAIAERFRVLADAGQPQGGMVLLLGRMTNADVYARAFRDEGLDCVIAGGSVFAQAPEVQTVRALACTLANPADTAQGLMPLLASPMFALGAQEFLTLSTRVDPETGETSRRNLDTAIFSDNDAPGLGGNQLLVRARQVMRRALYRVGKDPVARIARDAVNESGWLVRLAGKGPEGKAVAANVLKALDALEEAESELGCAPRQVALAFDRFLEGKEAPGALNEEGGGAIRIMTVHASKGLEYPVVAVSECFGIRPASGSVQMGRVPGGARVVALPGKFADVRLADGSVAKGDDVRKQFEHAYKGTGASLWLPPELMEDVCPTGSPAEAFAKMRADDNRLSLEERARLLYVAMTRAKELVILAMDAPVSRGKGNPISFNVEQDLTYDVLRRILPSDASGIPVLDSDRLVFENAQPGDYGLLCLADCALGETRYGVNAELDDAGRLVRLAGDDGTASTQTAVDVPAAPGPADPGPDRFTLVYPAHVEHRATVAAPRKRDSYSYSSVAAELHAAEEDTVSPRESDGFDAAGDDAAAADERVAASGDPLALGSAFHAAAQWMIEMDGDEVPEGRLDALCRGWGVTPEQRVRLEAALGRWCGSAIRRELRDWPLVRAEVPFFSLGIDGDTVRERFGSYAEGAIDALATDPGDPSRALVVDYKTGGSVDETPEQLRQKHQLQARVYADVLHKAGFEHVSLAFVRVEIDDPDVPGEPQVVRYEL